MKGRPRFNILSLLGTRDIMDPSPEEIIPRQILADYENGNPSKGSLRCPFYKNGECPQFKQKKMTNWYGLECYRCELLQEELREIHDLSDNFVNMPIDAVMINYLYHRALAEGVDVYLDFRCEKGSFFDYKIRRIEG